MTDCISTDPSESYSISQDFGVDGKKLMADIAHDLMNHFAIDDKLRDWMQSSTKRVRVTITVEKKNLYAIEKYSVSRTYIVGQTKKISTIASDILNVFETNNFKTIPEEKISLTVKVGENPLED